MTGILFWNTHNNTEINKYIIDAVAEHNCGIVVLAEYANDINGLCNELSLRGKDFKPFKILCDRIKIIAEACYSQEMIFENSYVSIQNINIFGNEFLLAALHLPNKLHSGEDEHRALASETVREVKEAANKVGHENIIVIGDFNANPFEKVLISADLFHAVPDLRISQKKRRTVNGMAYAMYYNPMWNLLGDFNRPEGSYFYNSGKIVNYFWNIFDQVIFSPDASKAFEQDSLKIIDSVNGTLLVDGGGIPDKKNISDHLPIYFRFKEENL